MKHINFVTLGMIALASSLGACAKYNHRDMNYELHNDQRQVSLVVGDSLETSLYNVKHPIALTFTAPENSKLVINNVEQSTYTINILPQEAINEAFTVKKNNDINVVQTYVTTYKSLYQPLNSSVLKEKSGKYKKVVGQNNYYNLENNPSEVVVELHEHNNKPKHYFYYMNGSKQTTIKMLAPNYTSFVFENGIKTKEYNFELNSGDDYYFSLKLSQDNVENTYTRTYRFNRK